MGVVILDCTCKSSYQDELYGPKRRAHNSLPKAEKDAGKFRCSVCSTEREKRAEAKKGKADKEAEAKAKAEDAKGKKRPEPSANGKAGGKGKK